MVRKMAVHKVHSLLKELDCSSTTWCPSKFYKKPSICHSILTIKWLLNLFFSLLVLRQTLNVFQALPVSGYKYPICIFSLYWFLLSIQNNWLHYKYIHKIYPCFILFSFMFHTFFVIWMLAAILFLHQFPILQFFQFYLFSMYVCL